MVRLREITTLGSLMSFAMDLEAEARDLCTRRADAMEGEARRVLRTLAEGHERRRQELQRMLREDLNEVTLEPLRGMETSAYGREVGAVVEFEGNLKSFYLDAADTARAQPSHLVRSLRRFASEAEAFAAATRAPLS